MITLNYPANSPTNSIELPSPEYGNAEQFDTGVMFHISMDNTIRSYKKAKRQIFLLEFSALSKAKIAEYITFYTASAGAEIEYVDTLGNTWYALVLSNPIESIVTIGLGSCELNSMTIQMQVSADAIIELIDDDLNTLVDGDGNILISA